jgi:hypothetical protein
MEDVIQNFFVRKNSQSLQKRSEFEMANPVFFRGTQHVVTSVFRNKIYLHQRFS